MRCFCGCKRKVPIRLRRLNRRAVNLGRVGLRLDKKVQCPDPRFIRFREEGLELQTEAAGAIHRYTETPGLAILDPEARYTLPSDMQEWSKRARRFIRGWQKEEAQNRAAVGAKILARKKAEGISTREAAEAFAMDRLLEQMPSALARSETEKSDD